MELQLDLLLGGDEAQSAYHDVISYPALRQDLAVVLAEDVAAAKVLDAVREAAGALLDEVGVFDVYSGPQVGRVGARSRCRSPSGHPIARSPTRTWHPCASGSSPRWQRLEVSCVPELCRSSQMPMPAWSSWPRRVWPAAPACLLGVSFVPKALVAGATGFAGALAAHLLWRHPQFDLQTVTARADAGQRWTGSIRATACRSSCRSSTSTVMPTWTRRSSPTRTRPRLRSSRHCERVVCASSISARTFALQSFPPTNSGTARIRTRSCSKTPPTVCRSFTARRSPLRPRGDPGCYPTASLLGLAPLARAGLIADLVIDAKQGLSGTGRSATWQTHFSNSGENILPYNIVHHRHTPEIEQQLDDLDPTHPGLRVQFTPHLVPLDQGELVNCYVTPTRPIEQDELDVMYEDAYAGESFVEMAPEPAEVRDVRETNICRLHVAASEHTGKVVVLSAIDNLWKGTSSQAVQNLNLMFGFPEAEGLA